MESFKNYYHTQDKRGARRFLEIREAYDESSDPERRRQYDRVYRAHTALRVIEADVVNPSLFVSAEPRCPAPRKQTGFRRRRPRRPERSEQ